MDLILPKDGSIVIIDDQYSDAKPLLDILTINGHPSIYFDGKIDSLPKNSANENIFLERVRIVFADIQLIPALNGDQYASLIIEHLNLLISKSNGPYILIVWSGKEVQFADILKERINADGFEKKPIAFIRLDKTDYFKSIITKSIDIDILKEEFKTRLDAEDIQFIIAKIEEHLPEKVEKICNKTALSKISKKIKTNLNDYKAFELLIKWEHLVTTASTKLTAEFAALHTINEHWDYNFRNVISRLAQAQVGDFLQKLNAKDFVNASFKTINSAFSTSLDNDVTSLIKFAPKEFSLFKASGYIKNVGTDIYKILWNNFVHYELYLNSDKKGANQKDIKRLSSAFGNDMSKKLVVDGMIGEYANVNPRLNTKLNIDFQTSSPFQPGSTYEITVESENKRQFLNQTYFEKSKLNFLEKDNNTGLYKISDEEISQILFVEIEVSPNCDFANNKWLKHRTVSGILFPVKLGIEKLQSGGDSLYTGFPVLEINGKLMHLVISFKLLKAFDLTKGKKRSKNFVFKIREQPMADIVTRMASHATRIGLIEFK